MSATRIAAVQMVSGPDIAQNLRDGWAIFWFAAIAVTLYVVGSKAPKKG